MYCIRVGDQYVSGLSAGLGCIPQLVSNYNFAYVYDTKSEAEAIAQHLRALQPRCDTRIEKM